MIKSSDILVSIIIPLYNSEKYIKETLNSCINQTYKNIEIIIIDDESTDKSYEIASNVVNEYNNIHIFKQKNSGAQIARNFGISKAKGTYFQFLDADDILSKNKISSQMALAEEYGEDFLYTCKFKKFYETINDSFYQSKLIDKSFDDPIDWLITSWSNGGMAQTSIWLLSRRILNKIGLWDEKLKKNQDGEFFCRAVLKSKKIIYDDIGIVYYRITGNTSISYQMNINAAESTLFSYSLYEKHIDSLDNKDLKKAVSYNYISFINHYYPNFNNLLETSENRINNLGFKLDDFKHTGYIGLISNFIGFKNTLKLRHYLRKIKRIMVVKSND